MRQRAASIVDIPELLGIVCNLSSAADLVAFSQVCRHVFYVVIPFIWTNVDGLNNLLGLLPNTLVQRGNSIQRFSHSRLIRLPSLQGTSYERFDLYARHVKHLKIYSENVQRFPPSGWSVLSDRSQTHTLLPSLRSLTVHKYMADPQGEEELNWITHFIGPSLRAFRYQLEQSEFQVARMPKAAVMVLLDPLVEHCLALERLAIYPKAGSRSCYDLAATFGTRAFSHLRELSGSVALVAADVFPVIGALPRLERLSIHAYDQFMPELADSLPPQAFPALKHFTLSTYYAQDALDLSRFQPLVSSLESLEFRCDLYAHQGETWDTKSVSQQIVASWLVNPHALKTLRVDLDPEDNGYDSIDFTSTQAVEHIVRSRIESLYLNGAHFEPYDTFVTPGDDWSFLKKLHMPGYQTTLETLAEFTYAPNLEHLTVSLLFDGVYLRSVSFVPNSSLQVLQCTNVCGELFQVDELDPIAWLLLSMWPRIQDIRGPEVLKSVENPFDQLNEYVAYLRESHHS